MVSKNNHRISLTLSKEDFERFEHCYPNCLSKFLRSAIQYALGDKDFFQAVFFQELDDACKNYCVDMMNRLDGVLK